MKDGKETAEVWLKDSSDKKILVKKWGLDHGTYFAA